MFDLTGRMYVVVKVCSISQKKVKPLVGLQVRKKKSLTMLDKYMYIFHCMQTPLDLFRDISNPLKLIAGTWCLAGDTLWIWNPWKSTSKVKCTKDGKLSSSSPSCHCICSHTFWLKTHLTTSSSCTCSTIWSSEFHNLPLLDFQPVQVETAQRGTLHPGRGRESSRYGLLHPPKNSWSEDTAYGRGHGLRAACFNPCINWLTQ